MKPLSCALRGTVELCHRIFLLARRPGPDPTPEAESRPVRRGRPHLVRPASLPVRRHTVRAPCKRGRPGKVGLAEGAGGVGLPFPKGRKRPPLRDATQQRRDHGKEGLESVTIHLCESETTLTVKTAIYNDTNVESRIPRKRVLIGTHL